MNVLISYILKNVVTHEHGKRKVETVWKSIKGEVRLKPYYYGMTNHSKLNRIKVKQFYCDHKLCDSETHKRPGRGDSSTPWYLDPQLKSLESSEAGTNWRFVQFQVKRCNGQTQRQELLGRAGRDRISPWPPHSVLTSYTQWFLALAGHDEPSSQQGQVALLVPTQPLKSPTLTSAAQISEKETKTASLQGRNVKVTLWTWEILLQLYLENIMYNLSYQMEIYTIWRWFHTMQLTAA